MKDRVPKYPGRVTLVPVAGQENTFDMVRADEPTQSGDPLNKNTLLKDVTASLFGMGANAVPDDVFDFLGKYNLHWWLIRGSYVRTWYEEVRTLAGNVVLINWVNNASYAVSIPYSDSIDIGDDGTISLVSQKTVNVSYNNMYTTSDVLENKYAIINRTLYFIPSGVSLSGADDSENGKYRVAYDRSRIYTVASTKRQETITTDGDYLHSADRNAYPDSGVVDEAEYRYLGVPFDNAVTAPKIETGSYTGTETVASTGGYSKTLTFAKIPDMIFILGKNNTNGNMSFAFVTPVGGKGTQPNSTGVATGLQALSVTTTENSITWSGMGEAVQTVRNHTYYYWAIFGGAAS